MAGRMQLYGIGEDRQHLPPSPALHLIRSEDTLNSDVIAQRQLLGMRIEVDLVSQIFDAE